MRVGESKRILSVLLGLALVVSMAACGEKKDEGPDYADDEAMSVIQDGYQKRSDKIDELQAAGEDTTSNANLKTIVRTELDVDKPLQSRQFKDSKLQEEIVKYINTLNDSLALLDNNSSSNADFITEWNKVRDERSSILKVFVDTYNLKVDEKYQDDLDELVANGAAATKKSEADETIKSLISNATWEKTDDGYGFFTYSATIQNTSQLNFTNVGLVLGLYDATGVKAGETYANVSSWKAGETVRFESSGEVDTARIEASIQYYDTAE